ncbi:MAG: glutamate--tRNA ligase [Candidatus Saelkia tenebricola]|nr:glutamate--tRNA ligase [Candidatus Saelkia tenebricola]
MNEVSVRFAPSPTGFLHVGGARTALFNYLFARHNKGKFVLRIEDTDQERSEKEFLDEILTSLKWIGIDWDEGPIYQSERFGIYQEQAQKLLSTGLAYEEKTERGVAIRYKPKTESIKFNDLIRGEIEFKEGFEDIVIMKSDGTPTYNFACVIDDAQGGITHIIRGEDHISNTPKQIVLYKALKFNVPCFAHLPLILGEDRSRLSKRHGAVALSAYKDEGYLPQALFNFLALLGWSPGDNREILTKKELMNLFTLDRINKSNAVFDVEKLKWMNKRYLKNTSDADFKKEVSVFIEREGYLNDYQALEDDKRDDLFRLLKPRAHTFKEYAQNLNYIFSSDYPKDAEAVKKHLSEEKNNEMFSALKERFKKIEDFSKEKIEQEIRALAVEINAEAKELIHPLRVLLTGREVSPPLFELMEILGRDEVLVRIESFLT